jgi:myosin-5
MHAGLQTPRLKRLAEIVSQQAIAQQEKLEFDDDVVPNGSNGDAMNALNGLGLQNGGGGGGGMNGGGGGMNGHDTIEEGIEA